MPAEIPLWIATLLRDREAKKSFTQWAEKESSEALRMMRTAVAEGDLGRAQMLEAKASAHDELSRLLRVHDEGETHGTQAQRRR